MGNRPDHDRETQFFEGKTIPELTRMRNASIVLAVLFPLLGGIAVAMGIDKSRAALGIILGIACAAVAVLLVLAAVQTARQLRIRKADTDPDAK